MEEMSDDNKIIKITIQGESGLCFIDDAYTESLVVDAESIWYEYKPNCENYLNYARKWSYKTMSSNYKDIFKIFAKAIEKILDRDWYVEAKDIGPTSITVTYADKTRKQCIIFLPDDGFNKCAKIIRLAIPPCEDIPKILQIDEDDSEDEE